MTNDEIRKKSEDPMTEGRTPIRHSPSPAFTHLAREFSPYKTDTSLSRSDSDASYMAISHTRIRLWRRSLPRVGEVLGALCILLLQPGNVLANNATQSVQDSSVQNVRAVPRVLHFTAADVVLYFNSVLGMPPKRSKKGETIFEDNKSRWPEDRYRILITQEDGDVVVSFAVGGDYGMNFAREFFECPLFQRAESEQLYKLLNEAEKAPTAALPRFSVSMRSWETKDKVHLVLRFSRPAGMVAGRSPR